MFPSKSVIPSSAVELTNVGIALITEDLRPARNAKTNNTHTIQFVHDPVVGGLSCITPPQLQAGQDNTGAQGGQSTLPAQVTRPCESPLATSPQMCPTRAPMNELLANLNHY